MLIVDSQQKHRDIFLQWLSSRFETSTQWESSTQAIAHVDYQDNGVINILAVCAFHHFVGTSCEITIASNGEKRQKATFEYINACLHHAFVTQNRTVIYAFIECTNDKSIALAEKMKFEKVGTITFMYGANDGYVYTLKRNQWQKLS